MGHIIWLVLESVIFVGFVVVVAYLALVTLGACATLIYRRGDH